MIDHYKPAGIVLIAIYSGLFALAGLPMGCTVAFVGLPGASVMVLVGSLLASLAVFMLAAAYALWTLQAWGRAYTWWLYLACIPLGLMAIFPVFPGQQMSAGNTALQVIGIAIDLAVLVYLSRPEIKALFKADARERWSEQFVRREPHF